MNRHVTGGHSPFRPHVRVIAFHLSRPKSRQIPRTFSNYLHHHTQISYSNSTQFRSLTKVCNNERIQKKDRLPNGRNALQRCSVSSLNLKTSFIHKFSKQQPYSLNSATSCQKLSSHHLTTSGVSSITVIQLIRPLFSLGLKSLQLTSRSFSSTNPNNTSWYSQKSQKTSLNLQKTSDKKIPSLFQSSPSFRLKSSLKLASRSFSSTTNDPRMQHNTGDKPFTAEEINEELLRHEPTHLNPWPTPLTAFQSSMEAAKTDVEFLKTPEEVTSENAKFFTNNEIYARYLLSHEINRLSRKYFPSYKHGYLQVCKELGVDEAQAQIEAQNYNDGAKLHMIISFWVLDSNDPPEDVEGTLKKVEAVLGGIATNNPEEWRTLLCLAVICPHLTGRCLQDFLEIVPDLSDINDMIWSTEMIIESILRATSKPENYTEDEASLFISYLQETFTWPQWTFVKEVAAFHCIEQLREQKYGPADYKAPLSLDWIDPYLMQLLVFNPKYAFETLGEDNVARLRSELLRLPYFQEDYWPLITSIGLANYQMGYLLAEELREQRFVAQELLNLTGVTEWSEGLGEKLGLLAMYTDLPHILALLTKVPDIKEHLAQVSYLDQLYQVQCSSSLEIQEIAAHKIQSLTPTLWLNIPSQIENWKFFSKFVPKYQKVTIMSIDIMPSLIMETIQTLGNFYLGKLDVLEVGCGTGATSLFYTFPKYQCASNDIGSYLAIDNSKERLAYAEWFIQQFPEDNDFGAPAELQFRAADFFQLTPEVTGKEKFHAIVCDNFAHYAPSLDMVISKLNELLHDRGVAYLSVYTNQQHEDIIKYRTFLHHKFLQLGYKPLYKLTTDPKKDAVPIRFPNTREMRVARKLVIDEFGKTPSHLFKRMEVFTEMMFVPHMLSIPNWQEFLDLLDRHTFSVARILPTSAKDITMVSSPDQPPTTQQANIFEETNKQGHENNPELPDMYRVLISRWHSLPDIQEHIRQQVEEAGPDDI